MNRRLLAVLASLALVLAACGGGGDPTTTTSGSDQPTTTEAPTTSTTAAPSAEATRLAYALADGQSYTFEIDLDQNLTMQASGDTSAMGEEEMPENADLAISGTGLFTYTVAAGSQAGTFEIRVVGEFSDLEVSGTVDGEPVDPSEIPEIAEVEPIDLTFVVDEQGNPVGGDNELEGMFEGLLGGLEGLSGLSGGSGDLRFFGPPLADKEVAVGDSWTNTIEMPGMEEDQVFTTEIESTVTGTENIDGASTFVIETTSSTPLIEFDMAELIVGMLEGFLHMFGEPSEEELAEFMAMADQIRFFFRVPATSSESTAWFDAEAGITRKLEASGSAQIHLDVAMPDQETGEMVALKMDMTTSQNLTFRLVDSTEG